MGMIIYKGEIQGEGATGVEIYVKDISEIEMGDKTENGYKIEPKIVEGDLGEKTYQYNIPLGMIIGNSAIVGSDQQSFVIPKKEAPVDIELSNGSRATFGESANRFVAQGLRIIAANSKNIEDIDIQPEDLYTEIQSGTKMGYYYWKAPYVLSSYDGNSKIIINSKSFTQPQQIELSFSCGGTSSLWYTNRFESYTVCTFTLDKGDTITNIGVCFISSAISSTAPSESNLNFGCARIFTYLVVLTSNNKKLCQQIWLPNSFISPHFPDADYLSHEDSSLINNNSFVIPFASQAEYDFASGITNSYSYMTYEEYKAALQS